MSTRRFLSVAAAALALCGATPLVASAQTSRASCPTTQTHILPKGASTTVFRFGVKGGSLRPWSIKLQLGGTIVATGAPTTRTTVSDPKNALTALLALADAQGFFALKGTIGCTASAGNPDVSSRFLSIHTSTGTKTVQEFGSCAATARYDGLFDLLEATAGMGS